ncbi:hypothetical protein CEXT_40351 [Caerostris extrusa]|uniref:Uncharacterized protein n=1 Tax=Caerostris extrusa TaxID=172846 RepID=A0AAV4YB06_CAEEX|nr:hypothetical protein CEXT_40351 [Caerostris extrusa]
MKRPLTQQAPSCQSDNIPPDDFHLVLIPEQSRGLGGKVALQGQVADEPEPGRWTRVVGRPQSFLINRTRIVYGWQRNETEE